MIITVTDAHDIQDMERLAAGQDARLDDLMERHGNKLFRYLIRVLGDEREAEEVTQETFVRVYQNREKFDSAHRFSSWLYRIATNLARDHLRRRHRRMEVPLRIADIEGEEIQDKDPCDPEPDPGEGLIARERGQEVRSAIQSLPDELRIPIILSEYDGLPQRDIGQILGCSAKAVEMRLYRARRALRDALAPILADP